MFQTLWTKWWSFSPKKYIIESGWRLLLWKCQAGMWEGWLGEKGRRYQSTFLIIELHNQTRCHQTSSGSLRFTQPCCTRWSPSAGPAGARWKWNQRLRFKWYFLNSISQPAFRHLRPRLRWFSRNYHLFLTFRHMRPRSSYAVQVIV